jgi:hypothetical protein
MRRCLPSISRKLQLRELNGRLAPITANLEERARHQKRTRGIRPASCCDLQRFPFIWDHSVIPYERETP